MVDFFLGWLPKHVACNAHNPAALYTLEIRIRVSVMADNSGYKLLLQAFFTSEVGKVITGKDAAATLRLALHDAATYNVLDGTGGLNGSIVLR